MLPLFIPFVGETFASFISKISFVHEIIEKIPIKIKIIFYISDKFNRLILCNDFGLLDFGVHHFPIGFKVYVLYV